MYGKIINETIIKAPNAVQIGDRVYYNPTDETYRKAGYLPIADVPCPTSDDTEAGTVASLWDSHWEERDGQIVRVWTARPV